MLGLAMAWVCLGQPVLDDPCSEASSACRRAAQSKILEWRQAALDAQVERDEANATITWLLTTTSSRAEAPGLRLLAGEVERRVEAEEEGPGFWTGLLVGLGAGVLGAGVVAGILVGGQ